jgi:phage tail protein X
VRLKLPWRFYTKTNSVITQTIFANPRFRERN